MHLKVFVKLKKTLKTLSSGQKTQKKPKKTQKTPKNPTKPKKKPMGWVLKKKPGFFPTLLRIQEAIKLRNLRILKNSWSCFMTIRALKNSITL
jgi:hypothetical protein